MSKRKSIILLTIVSVLMAAILCMTFLRFPIGVKDYNSAIGAIELDYDMQGGLAYTLSFSQDNDEQVGEDEIGGVVEEIEQRLEALGYSIYTVKAFKSTDSYVTDYSVRIEIKESEYADSDIAAVATYGNLKFYGGTETSPTTEILSGIKVIEDSTYVGYSEDNAYVISLVFTEEGRTKLLDEIGSESNYYLRITCGVDENGDEVNLFNPTSGFDTSLLANGNREVHLSTSSASNARQMALKFKLGGLDYKYDLKNNGLGVQVEAPYGNGVALKCAVAIATLILVAIILFLLLYKGLGIVSVLSLILFILAETWLLIGVPGIVVNLGSIAGIVLSSVVCILSLVMLMQRIKDEFANSEKTAKAAINKGFKESLVPTISVHGVSAIVALLLFIFTKGIVNGFAITFGIGVLVSLIVSVVFTRLFNALILPLPKNKEKFLKFKRTEKVGGEM